MPPERERRGPASEPRHSSDALPGAGSAADASPGRPAGPAHDALLLAGGRARRLGGASKPDVLLGGRRLIDRALEAASAARQVVVVGPADVAPPGVIVTLEDPPDGGPVAGIAAGLAALTPGSDLVLILACDVPRAAGARAALLAAVDSDRPGAGSADGAVLVDADGRVQPLVGLYRRRSLDAALAALAAGGGVRDASVHRLLRPLRLVRVPDPGGNALDVDTWEDLARAERSVRDA